MDSFFINKNFRKLRFVLVVAGFCFFLLYGMASADCIETFSWLPNTESNVVSYKIYYGQADGGPYPNVVNVGNPAPVDSRIHGTVPGLTCGQQYYFVCVAVNDVNIEGPYSSQAAVTPNSGIPGSPINLMIIE